MMVYDFSDASEFKQSKFNENNLSIQHAVVD